MRQAIRPWQETSPPRGPYIDPYSTAISIYTTELDNSIYIGGKTYEADKEGVEAIGNRREL